MVARLSNAQSVKAFTDELTAYEAAVAPKSDSFAEFKEPALLIKEPLLRLICASPADSLSMMRKLTARMTGQLDGAYSDYIIAMLGVSTQHELTRQLITAILYNLRTLITGGQIDINNQEWFDIANGNEAIRTFMNGYNVDHTTIVGEVIAGDTPPNIKNTTHHLAVESDYQVVIGNDNYVVNLELNERQTLTFTLDPAVTSSVVNSDLTISSSIGWFAVNKTVKFTENVLAQMDDLRCLTAVVDYVQDTVIKLPGQFYSIVFHVTTSDAGVNWTIAEVSIVPRVIT